MTVKPYDEVIEIVANVTPIEGDGPYWWINDKFELAMSFVESGPKTLGF